MCVCVCAHARARTHVRALIHVFGHCGCMRAPVSVYPHICDMDVSILACMSLYVLLFLDIYRILNWSSFVFGFCVMFIVNPEKNSKLNK